VGKNDMSNCKVLFFLGEEPTNLIGPEYIYLKGVTNDYLSASYKQQLGLSYIYENYDFDFVLTCGTDTFYHMKNLMTFLDSVDKTKGLYIGGDGDTRFVNNQDVFFHSGGSGFILTLPALHGIYPHLHNMVEVWKTICPEYLQVACDVCIAYFIKNHSTVHTETITNPNFHSCNHKGRVPCVHPRCCPMTTHKDARKHVIACHYMSPEDVDEYYNEINEDHELTLKTPRWQIDIKFEKRPTITMNGNQVIIHF
jgi:hypothetical protein